MLWTPGQPVRMVAVPIPATTASVGLFGRGCWLRGYSLTESSGAASAVVTLCNGSASLGVQLLPVDLTQSTTMVNNFGDPGVPFDNGLSLNVVSGQVKGAVWVVTLDPAF